MADFDAEASAGGTDSGAVTPSEEPLAPAAAVRPRSRVAVGAPVADSIAGPGVIGSTGPSDPLPAAEPDYGCGGVRVSEGCGCGAGASGPVVADVAPVRLSNVFALGTLGFDFGTEARRDTFRQLMPDVSRADGDDAQIRVAPNPYDVFQLVDYLNTRPSESGKLIWTLNLDLTPIYAIEAEPTYPEEVYLPLREALRSQALPLEDSDYVARVSIPGVLTNRTVRLFSGQVVPVIVAQSRGLYAWNETQLVDGVIGALAGQVEVDEGYTRMMIRSFLDKVYFECRNLGQSSSDRALNFAATNAYQFGAGIADGFLSGRNLVPGASDELYTLDSIEVSKSPYCRLDSDCWDVRVTFFDPVNDRRAKSVYMFTLDVSDVLPVTLSPYHRYLTT